MNSYYTKFFLKLWILQFVVISVGKFQGYAKQYDDDDDDEEGNPDYKDIKFGERGEWDRDLTTININEDPDRKTHITNAYVSFASTGGQKISEVWFVDRNDYLCKHVKARIVEGGIGETKIGITLEGRPYCSIRYFVIIAGHQN